MENESSKHRGIHQTREQITTHHVDCPVTNSKFACFRLLSLAFAKNNIRSSKSYSFFSFKDNRRGNQNYRLLSYNLKIRTLNCNLFDMIVIFVKMCKLRSCEVQQKE